MPKRKNIKRGEGAGFFLGFCFVVFLGFVMIRSQTQGFVQQADGRKPGSRRQDGRFVGCTEEESCCTSRVG